MKQAIFLIAVMAVLMYYGLAVLRPQAIWQWSLPPDVRWSLYAAIIAVVAAAIHAGALGKRAAGNSFLLLVAAFGLCLAGRAFVEENADWDRITEKFEGIIVARMDSRGVKA